MFLCPWNVPSNKTGVGCHFLLQGIFLTQALNTHLPCLLHWQADSLPLSHLEKPRRTSVQFSSVAQLCPTLSDPMNHITPGLAVHHQLLDPPKPMSTVLVMHPTISSSVVPLSSCPPPFPASGSFQMNQFFASGGQSIGVSAAASILPMNIQG